MNENSLGSQNINKLIVNYSVPCIICMVLNGINILTDKIFLGKYVGEAGLSTFSVCYPITTIVFAISVLIGLGAASRIAILWGSGQKKAAESVLANSLLLSLLASVVLSVLGLASLTWLLPKLGASGAVLEASRTYSQIWLGGCLVYITSQVMFHNMRACEHPVISALTVVISACCNIGFNYLLMAKMQLGIAGNALAFVLAQTAALAWIMLNFYRLKDGLKLRKTAFKLSRQSIWSIINIGVSPFLLQLAVAVATVVFNVNLVKYGGHHALACASIVVSVYGFFFMPVNGLNQGIQPILGFNYGAQKYSRALAALKTACLSATAFLFICWLAAQIAPGIIFRTFNAKPEILAMGAPALKIYLIMLPVLGFGYLVNNFFQSVGQAHITLICNTLRQALLLIPLYILLPKIMGLAGIWLAVPLADLFLALVMAWLLWHETKKRLSQSKPKAKVLAKAS